MLTNPFVIALFPAAIKIISDYQSSWPENLMFLVISLIFTILLVLMNCGFKGGDLSALFMGFAYPMIPFLIYAVAMMIMGDMPIPFMWLINSFMFVYVLALVWYNAALSYYNPDCNFTSALDIFGWIKDQFMSFTPMGKIASLF